MKKVFLFVTLLIGSVSFGQAPQGVNYQAVAYDSEGFEISNQDISVRLGILLGAVDAEASYTEVHSVTTDDFGLFSLVISQGETSDTFSSINWEEGAYLKVEVDEDLDGEYSIMGVSSFNAVPYALYAETSSVDSTMVADMIVASSGGSCSFNYPDGYNGSPIIHDFINNGSYTVPSGKNFYTNTIAHNTADDIFINSAKIWNSGNMYSNLNIILSEGDVVSMDTMLNTSKMMFGFLIDKKVQSIILDFLANGAYTVPSGKKLYIYRIYHNALHIEVNSKAIATDPVLTNDHFLKNHLVFQSGDIIDIIDQGSGGVEYMFGYLADENYFAGCGGGGSSNSGTGNMVVSTFGDTLTMNGQSIIVPGISVQNFPSSLMGSVTDVDGNTYPTIILGNQEWMAANLNTTHFSNGNNLNDNSGSGNSCASQPGYKDNLNGDNFRFYNALAVHDSRNVCPTGWHVPSKPEFETVFDMFGYFSDSDWIESAIAMKSTAPFAWQYSITSNASMLNFKPDGIIYCGTNYMAHTTESWTWTSTPVGGTSTHNIKMNDNSGNVSSNSNVMIGGNTNDYNLPIRCVKD